MHWSRSAAVVSLSLLLFVPPAVAQTQAPAASGGAFKDACKAGYTYLVVPSASGVSVREAQKVNCGQKDGNGLLVNLYVRECWERIGDIYWDCRNALPAGTYKCEHKTCNEGEAISAPTANTFSAPMAASPREELPRVLTPGPEVRTAPLPPLSGKSIFDAFQETPTNTEQEAIIPRSTAADNFEKIMLQAGLAPGEIVPSTGNVEGSIPMRQTPSASDAVALQGGTAADVPTTRVQISKEAGGTAGESTFLAPQTTDYAAESPPQSCTSRTWGCWASNTWNNVLTGKIFDNSSYAGEAEPDTQRTITMLAVTKNDAAEVPASLFSPEAGAGAPGVGQPQADIDAMTPARLKEIEAQILADRSAQAQFDAAKLNPATPQAPNPLRVVGEAFGVLGGRDTGDLKVAWKDYVAALETKSRANPVTAVQVAELPPLPGTEPNTPSVAAQPLPETEESQLAVPAAESPAPDPSNFAELLRRKGLTEYIIEQKRQEIEAARTDLQARTEAYIEHTRALGYSDITQGAGWPTYEQWWKEHEERIEAFTAKVDAYRLGDAAVMQELDAALRTTRGGTSEGITGTIDAIRRNSDDVWNQTPSFWEDPVAATLGGATRLTEQAVASLLEADRNLLERTGPLGEALGFSDPERALGRVFDPVGENDRLAKDVALVAGTTVAPWAAGRVAGAIDSFGGTWAATLPRSVTTDIRVAMGESAGFPSAAARGGAEVAAEPTASGAFSSVSSEAAAIARTEVAANEIRAFSGARSGAPASGGTNPYAAFDDLVADARAAAGAEPAAQAPSALTPAAGSAAESGALPVSAGARTHLEDSVWNQTKGSWTGGTGATAGILCLGFCPASDPLPQEAIPAEVLTLTKEDLALLFPSENKVQEPSTLPGESVVPVEVVAGIPAQPLPLSASPLPEPPSREIAATAEQPAAPPPAVGPSVLSTSEPVSNFEEQQKIVEANIEAQRQKNDEAFRAWEEAESKRAEGIKEMMKQEQDRQIQADLPKPVLVSPETPTAGIPGTQGVGPLTSDDIARGLLPNPGNEGSRRKDIEVNFETGSSVPQQDGRTQIAALAEAMKKEEFRNSTFTIVGHTDTIGTSESNLILSRQRAQAIVNILNRDYGISLNQMTASGAGQWNLKVPILGNVPANRRVEIIVTPRR